MGVNLRGRDIGMAEDSLNSTQVGAVFYHVGSTAMAKHVRAGVASCARGRRTHYLPHALAGELARAAAQE
jgi:hypothetical protein